MKNSKQILGLTIGIALLISLIFPSENWGKAFMFNLLYSFGFTLANYLFFKKIGQNNSWKKSPQKTLILSIAGMIPLNIFVLFVLNFITSVIIYHNNFNEFLASQNLLSYFIAVLIACVIALFIITLHLTKDLKKCYNG